MLVYLDRLVLGQRNQQSPGHEPVQLRLVFDAGETVFVSLLVFGLVVLGGRQDGRAVCPGAKTKRPKRGRNEKPLEHDASFALISSMAPAAASP